MSQRVTCLSADDTASMATSVGCHATEVMGPVCHLKCATGSGEAEPNFLKSQTLNEASSLPLRRRFWAPRWFHEITFTSAVCAVTVICGFVFCRTSQTLTVL